MERLRFLTAGESHGPCLTVILEGIPAHLPLTAAEIDRDLARRQQGYGRGGRMRIEKDRVEIVGGVRQGRTTGAPIALMIRNRDWERWQAVMDPAPPDCFTEFFPASCVQGETARGETKEKENEENGWEKSPRGEIGESKTREVTIAGDSRLQTVSSRVTQPRPGHADLAGALKYGTDDVRDILERASARETAARVAAGAVARRLLAEFGIEVFSHVIGIGGIGMEPPSPAAYRDADFCRRLREATAASSVACPDPEQSAAMVEAIEAARANGDSLGGSIRVVARGMPVGLGSHIQWDRRLDGQLAQALMSIPAIKAVEVGLGTEVAKRPGSQVHDPILYQEGNWRRPSNNAGGIEGGISNGEPLVLTLTMKPIPTLYQPLPSADLLTHEAVRATVERSDITAVPAAAVVAEAMVALVLADAFLVKFGGDSLAEVRRNYQAYLAALA